MNQSSAIEGVSGSAQKQRDAFLNPVYQGSFPDPFILKFCGEYFGYCTGWAHDGLAIGVARSADLITWQYVGGALQQLVGKPPYYWAPEVTYHNGNFYLYYSCGNETLMEIRVAVSDRPDGGFVDSGYRLTKEDFAIDAHVFVDDDGQRYLFYATDFLTHSHIGTGTVVDKMVSWFELAGHPRPVSRAAYDWQVYDPQRAEKGGVRWHTVEGPTVFKHKSKYFEMFSGGNWQNSSYGVGYAVSDRVVREDEWDQHIDGSSVLPVLRTIPEKVIGPGHNSAVIGPNGRELFCVYHRWVGGERVMAIDRMGFAGDRLFVNGPTFTPQPAPLAPTIGSFTDPKWTLSGDWLIDHRSLQKMQAGAASAELDLEFPSSLIEFGLRYFGPAEAGSTFSAVYATERNEVCRIAFSPADLTITLTSGGDTREFRLWPGFDPTAFHHFRFDVDETYITIVFDDFVWKAETTIEAPATSFRLEAEGARVEAAGFTMTSGFVDRFERLNYDPIAAGWEIVEGSGEISVQDGNLLLTCGDGAGAYAAKGRPLGNFEFIATVRKKDRSANGSIIGFAVFDGEMKIVREFTIDELDGRFFLSDNVNGTRLPLPGQFQENTFRQFRFVKNAETLSIESEDSILGELKIDNTELLFGILSKRCSAAVEAVSLTRI